jgi:hypothetical protein
MGLETKNRNRDTHCGEHEDYEDVWKTLVHTMDCMIA